MAAVDVVTGDGPAGEEREAQWPAGERPDDPTPRHTADLPPTPQRDRTIHASAWVEAPDVLRTLADDLPDAAAAGEPYYLRRIGRWLLWRVGPARGADARYLAVHADDLTRTSTFRLFPDGTGDGEGPSGARHTRFRTWKEDLRDDG